MMPCHLFNEDKEKYFHSSQARPTMFCVTNAVAVFVSDLVIDELAQ